MICMKCGRETEPNQSFCKECLKEMEQYPVKPNVVVQIPNRPAPQKKIYQRRITPEEQVQSLRKSCRRLRIALAVVLLLALAAGAASGYFFMELRGWRNMGQNYSTVEETKS